MFKTAIIAAFPPGFNLFNLHLSTLFSLFYWFLGGSQRGGHRCALRGRPSGASGHLIFRRTLDTRQLPTAHLSVRLKKKKKRGISPACSVFREDGSRRSKVSRLLSFRCRAPSALGHVCAEGSSFLTPSKVGCIRRGKRR